MSVVEAIEEVRKDKETIKLQYTTRVVKEEVFLPQAKLLESAVGYVLVIQIGTTRYELSIRSLVDYLTKIER